MTMSTTPREKLAELRRLEAEAASRPQTVESTLPDPVPPRAEQTEQMPPRQAPVQQPDAADPWLIDVSDLAGGTFSWRTETINLSGPTVRATSAMHAAAIREHLTKLRSDLGMTPSGGTLRRMPTPGGTR